jgi:hypothetical protein
VPRRPVRAALAAAALAILACQGGRRGPPPERFLPAAVRAVVIVPETGRAASELADLHASVAAFPGVGGLAGGRGALAAQLGFDPLDPDALADAGVDRRRGAALALVDRPRAQAGPAIATLVVLPARDAPRLESLLVRLARDRMGAVERSAETRAGITAVVFRRPGSAAPSLTYTIVDRTALLTTHPAGPALVADAASLQEQASLAEAPAWKAARGALGEDVAALAFVPAGSPFLAGAWPLKDGVALGVSARSNGLVARAAILLGARAPSFRALAAEAAAAELPALDPRAQLVARWNGDFGALGRKLVPALPRQDRARFAARGIDLERDVFDLLAPGGAIALSLPAALDVVGLTAAAVRSDPLRALEFEAVLPVKDSDRAEAVSARLVARRKRPPSAGEVHRLRTASGEIAWVVEPGERRILAAGGAAGKLDALAARLAAGEGYRPPTAAAEAALSGKVGGAVLDAPRLVAAVRAMPPESFGTGPSGFVMRSLVERIVEPAARLVAVSLRAELAEGALVLSADVEARIDLGERR